jgi:hypothetical protein
MPESQGRRIRYLDLCSRYVKRAPEKLGPDREMELLENQEDECDDGQYEGEKLEAVGVKYTGHDIMNEVDDCLKGESQDRYSGRDASSGPVMENEAVDRVRGDY